MAEETGGMIWRRIAAAWIDGVLFVAAASLISVALYFGSNGVVRAPTFQPATSCAALVQIPAAVAAKAQAAIAAQSSRPVEAMLCRRVFLGFESGRFVSLTLEAQQGENVFSARVFQPVDRDGAPIEPVTFDWLYPFVFLLALTAFEATTGATPGKSAVGIRRIGLGGERPDFPRALARNILVYAWLFAWIFWPLAMRTVGPMLVEAGATLPVLQAAGWAPVLLLMAVPFLMLLFGRPPLYDRLTGLRAIKA